MYLSRTKAKVVGEYTATFDYDGYNLCKSIDAAGFVTEYEYDLIGRKIKEKRQTRVWTNFVPEAGTKSVQSPVVWKKFCNCS